MDVAIAILYIEKKKKEKKGYTQNGLSELASYSSQLLC